MAKLYTYITDRPLSGGKMGSKRNQASREKAKPELGKKGNGAMK